MKGKCFFFFSSTGSFVSKRRKERERERGGRKWRPCADDRRWKSVEFACRLQPRAASRGGSERRERGWRQRGWWSRRNHHQLLGARWERETERVYLIATRFGSDIYPVRKVAGTRPLATTCDIISPPFWNRWKINFISLKYVKFNKLWLYEVVN